MVIKKEALQVQIVKWFSDIKREDSGSVGKKGAYLGEMYKNQFPVPAGFLLTFEAYKYFMDKTGISKQIEQLLLNRDLQNIAKLDEISNKVRELIGKAVFPPEMSSEIAESYQILEVDKEIFANAKGSALDILKNSREPGFVAVRSSCEEYNYSENINSYSLNVKGKSALLDSIKKCYSSLFYANVLIERLGKDNKNYIGKVSVVIQKMISADKSGIVLSVNPMEKDENMRIASIWGLGEGISLGRVKPDSYLVSRDELKLIHVQVCEKEFAYVRNSSGETVEIKLTVERAEQQVLTGHEIKKLSQLALKLEEHFKEKLEISFAVSAGEIFVVGARKLDDEFTNKKYLLSSIFKQDKEMVFDKTNKEIVKTIEHESLPLMVPEIKEIKQEMKEIKKDTKITPTSPAPSSADIEEIILKELDSVEEGEEDYNPGPLN